MQWLKSADAVHILGCEKARIEEVSTEAQVWVTVRHSAQSCSFTSCDVMSSVVGFSCLSFLAIQEQLNAMLAEAKELHQANHDMAR